MGNPLVLAERDAFAQRLLVSLFNAGIGQSPTALARQYNARFPMAPVTNHAVRKWMLAEALPTQKRLELLAEMLGVSSQWLRYGEGSTQMQPGASREPIHNDIVMMLKDLKLLDAAARDLLIALVQKMLSQQSSGFDTNII